MLDLARLSCSNKPTQNFRGLHNKMSLLLALHVPCGALGYKSTQSLWGQADSGEPQCDPPQWMTGRQEKAGDFAQAFH